MVDAGFENQKELTKMQLDNQKEIAEIFFFNDTATTEIYTLSLHDALPICRLPLSATDPKALFVSTTKKETKSEPFQEANFSAPVYPGILRRLPADAQEICFFAGSHKAGPESP